MEHRSRTPLAILGAVAAGAAAAYAAWPERRPQTSRSQRDLTAYLHDHLSGSDVAVRVVRRLADSSARVSDRAFFRSLAEELDEERAALRSLLSELGASAASPKRVAGIVSGIAASLAAGADGDELSRLRTLEALTVAVQGKRCLWRALQGVNTLHSSHRLTFAELEAQAVAQWDALDARRRATAHQTFAAVAVGPRRRPH